MPCSHKRSHLQACFSSPIIPKHEEVTFPPSCSHPLVFLSLHSLLKPPQPKYRCCCSSTQMAESRPHKGGFPYLCPDWGHSLIQLWEELKKLWEVFSVITTTQNSVKHSSTERCYYEPLPIPQAGASISLSFEQSRECPISAGFTVLMGLPRHGVKGKDFQSRPSILGADQEIKILSRQDPISYSSFLSLGNRGAFWRELVACNSFEKKDFCSVLWGMSTAHFSIFLSF